MTSRINWGTIITTYKEPPAASSSGHLMNQSALEHLEAAPQARQAAAAATARDGKAAFARRLTPTPVARFQRDEVSRAALPAL